ncbi:ABC transporter ATP-binding protein [Kordiimonas aestuarii]|uniref:ABC transporter ATP-binding protein n=1 Tax=Kordiimonas aestuarii TaxID=1005925 RepID=UPI0021D21752|nr:ABC transporter ATP-binding protein [Kordiimonas aestuarii]
MSNPVLELQGIERAFRQGHKVVEVLRGIDLKIGRGELVGLVGASGSGKSTLLQIAGLLDPTDAGVVYIAGNDATSLKDDARAGLRQSQLGFVYQFHHLLPDFTAIENVAMALRIGGVGEKDANERAREILVRVGLEDRLEHTPSELSGGEQQRVAISRALVGNPVLLLADEPTGNLDESTAGKVFDLFVELVRERGLAALIATHDTTLAAKMDRRHTLREGTLHDT